MKKFTIFLSLIFIPLIYGSAFGATIIFQDTYESLSIGASVSENSPDIGTYSQIDGDNEIIAVGAGQALQINDLSSTTGPSLVAKPVFEPSYFKIEYDISFSPTTLVANNAYRQELIFDPIGTNMDLRFGADHNIYTMGTLPGPIYGSLLDTGFDWVENTTYHMVWTGDYLSDTLTLTMNSTVIFNSLSWGADYNTLSLFAIQSNFSTIGSQIVDNLTISAVPEPATMFLLGTGLVGVAGVARRKKKNQA